MTIQDMTTGELMEAFPMPPLDLGIAVLTSSSPTSHPSSIDHQVEMLECSVVIDNRAEVLLIREYILWNMYFHIFIQLVFCNNYSYFWCSEIKIL
jgi:hypothetical protein